MKDLIILGASGFAREVAWLVDRINKVNPTWNLLGFTEENCSSYERMINNYPILGDDRVISRFPHADLVCAIGSSQTRKKVIESIKSSYPSAVFATLIDPSVDIAETNTIGEGTIICAGNLITVNTKIGNHVIINLACTIGHDTTLDDYVTIYPNVSISGHCRIHERSELGTGAQVIQGLEVGENTIIGAGSTVVKSIPANCTAVGVPAKPIKIH